MRIFKEFILPTSILAGTIIGAGIFSLPYVFYQSGIGLGYFFLAIFGLAYIFIHLMYADVVIKNGNVHRFAGLAKIYFGKLGYWFSVIMTIVEMFFVLAIYAILSSSFISIIFPNIPLVYQVIIFWWLGSVVVFSGTKKVAIFENLAVLAILVLVGVIIWTGFSGFFEKSLTLVSGSWKMWLLPFGAILFSISGRPAIPTVTHYFARNGLSNEKSKKAIIWGTMIPVLAYGAFIAGVLGLSKTITADAISGVVASIPSIFLVLSLAILGIIALLSSYFTVGLDVLNSLRFDLNFSKKLSALLVVFLPLFIYFSNIGGFIILIEIAGGFFVGFEGIFIVAMWIKMRKSLDQAGIVRSGLLNVKVEPLRYFLYPIFIVSIIYVFVSVVFRF